MSKPLLDHQIKERCATCPIRDRAVCTYSSEDEIARLESIKFYRNYEPGQEIVAAGENVEFLGSLVEGVVSLSKTMSDGRRQMVGLMFASDFLGRPMRNSVPYDAVAITPVRLCLFRRRQFEKVMMETPSIERRLLEMMLDELDAARDWMLLLGRKTAREKIASFLVIIARRTALKASGNGAEGKELELELPITREAMADYLGLTIETVSRQFTALRKAGIIVLSDARRVRVPDLMALMDAAGEDGDGGLVA
ncbi:MAG: helix-turn-helix domain-containing protein [Pseudomonadota bacterium]